MAKGGLLEGGFGEKITRLGSGVRRGAPCCPTTPQRGCTDNAIPIPTARFPTVTSCPFFGEGAGFGDPPIGHTNPRVGARPPSPPRPLRVLPTSTLASRFRRSPKLLTAPKPGSPSPSLPRAPHVRPGLPPPGAEAEREGGGFGAGLPPPRNRSWGRRRRARGHPRDKGDGRGHPPGSWRRWNPKGNRVRPWGGSTGAI